MSKLIIKTQPMATNISLENFSTETQNILEPYITPYLSCKNKKERDDIIYKASVHAQMTIESVKSVLAWEKRRTQQKNINRIMEVHRNSSNEAFLEEYKIREQIPKDKLPCVAAIDMFGKVQYSKRVSGVPTSISNLQYLFKVSEEYVCSGFRT
jgi:hypothetical protein